MFDFSFVFCKDSSSTAQPTELPLLYTQLSSPDFSNVDIIQKLSLFALRSLLFSISNLNSLLLPEKDTIPDMVNNNIYSKVTAIISRNPSPEMVTACNDLLTLIGNGVYSKLKTPHSAVFTPLLTLLEVFFCFLYLYV